MTQYNRKINDKGEYLPFYGYTSISMLKDPLCKKRNIETFIRQSSIGKYYSALPHSTYHMTLFNIYCMASTPIPSVARWVDKEHEIIPETLWLPEDVLKVQHIRAGDVLRKLGPLKIQNINFYYKSGLGVWITLDKDDEEAVIGARKDLSAIYEHGDERLKLHITFAYLFKKLPSNNSEDFELLKKDMITLLGMLDFLKHCNLDAHNVYLYNSMTNYLPIDFFFSSNILPSST